VSEIRTPTIEPAPPGAPVLADGSALAADRAHHALAIIGFMLVAFAQVSNMILARGLAGSVPPFSLAFFRWTIIAAGLLPFALAEIRQRRIALRASAWPILAAGFLGMFLCGGPVYIAGISTNAIHIALIMALSPITVLLLSFLLGMEKIGRLQLLGMGLALTGALIIISGGQLRALTGLKSASGDLMVLIAMLGWSGYTRQGRRLLFVCRSRSRRDRLCRLRLARHEVRLGALLARALYRPRRQRAAVICDSRRAADLDSCARRRADPRRRLGQSAKISRHRKPVDRDPFRFRSRDARALRSTRIRVAAHLEARKFPMPDRARGTKIAGGDLTVQALIEAQENEDAQASLSTALLAAPGKP
jgi:hypothetical protein